VELKLIEFIFYNFNSLSVVEISYKIIYWSLCTISKSLFLL